VPRFTLLKNYSLRIFDVLFKIKKITFLQLDRNFLYITKNLLHSMMSTPNFIYDITLHY